jgi:toxin ParE1/3/4
LEVDEIRFHPDAQAEYQAALAWYQARTPQAADRFEAEMDQVVRSIKTNPFLAPMYDDEHRFSMLRRFPYSVVYRAEPGQILIVAVAHSRRATGYWQGRT